MYKVRNVQNAHNPDVHMRAEGIQNKSHMHLNSVIDPQTRQGSRSLGARPRTLALAVPTSSCDSARCRDCCRAARMPVAWVAIVVGLHATRGQLHVRIELASATSRSPPMMSLDTRGEGSSFNDAHKEPEPRGREHRREAREDGCMPHCSVGNELMNIVDSETDAVCACRKGQHVRSYVASTRWIRSMMRTRTGACASHYAQSGSRHSACTCAWRAQTMLTSMLLCPALQNNAEHHTNTSTVLACGNDEGSEEGG
ncbi:hypothetical protein GGX14DRAFT_397224 [Mycena pura]|uniref:Uncharacterized protein n=1 Tax=Mycena pura TaxID=153505 RepID=A0AAD6VA53_9AGAR|nr:hypothetical protein GGX14DRAFT_397224 [Mycena pura]